MSFTTGKPNIADELFKALDKAVVEATKKIFDEAIEKATKDAEAERDKIIARAAMSVSSWYSYENLGTTLRIEVKKPEPPHD